MQMHLPNVAIYKKPKEIVWSEGLVAFNCPAIKYDYQSLIFND